MIQKMSFNFFGKRERDSMIALIVEMRRLLEPDGRPHPSSLVWIDEAIHQLMDAKTRKETVDAVRLLENRIVYRAEVMFP